MKFYKKSQMSLFLKVIIILLVLGAMAIIYWQAKDIIIAKINSIFSQA